MTQAPLARAGTTEGMANGFLYLGSDELSYMTGADLLIDGGCGPPLEQSHLSTYTAECCSDNRAV